METDFGLYSSYGEDIHKQKLMNKLINIYIILVLKVGTPNPSQINQWSGTRFGGGNDPILLQRATTGQSTAMSIATSLEDCIKL